MRLTKLTLENVMELEGSMAFPEGKAVVIYGENKAGKSNIIHALRYAFLNKVIRSGRSSGYDELKLVTGKEIAPAEGVGRISIEFEHDGRQFEIRREVDRYRDNNRILRKETEGFRELDFTRTLDKELKAGLLNALFAPDSAMGFNHLNERNIDAVIRELFKEIGNAKVLSKNFKQRIGKLKEEAAARVVGIERDYNSFVGWLRDELEDAHVDLSYFDAYEPGRTAEKISHVADELKRYIDSIEKGELKQWLKEMRNRAKYAEDVEKSLKEDEEVRICFHKIEEISQDERHLSLFLSQLKEIKLGSPVPQGPGKFYDGDLDNHAKNIYHKLEDAQTRYSNALSLAQAENIDLKIDNPARIKSDKEKVLKLLAKEVLVTDAPRVKATLVKIKSESGEESVHGLIPLKLMKDDTAFTKLSPEPIPDAAEEDKREYAQILRKETENLSIIYEDNNKAKSFFDNEFVPGITTLSGYRTTLMQREKEEREKISKLVKDVHGSLLLLTQGDIQMPRLECQGDLEPFLLSVSQIVSGKRSDYREKINENVESMGLQATEFNTHQIDTLLWELTEMEKELPVYRNISTELARQKRSEWENNDAEYANLTYVPGVAEGIDKTLDTILDNAFDEQEVIQGIQEVIVEINNKLVAEDLVNSCIEMGEGSLQLSKTTYKEREITHPCGAERSFFSLATLTALAMYFRLPVIIDEAANNLDKHHLRHFISLVREFAASYEVQYILSIKETDDFPLDGWVQEFADDLQIYRVECDGDKKYIKPVEIYA